MTAPPFVAMELTEPLAAPPEKVPAQPSRPLRFTSLLFLVPAVVASPPIAALLALNAAVSFAVHSFDRPERTYLDMADNILVGLWVCVNVSLLRGARLAVPAVMCAVAAGALAIYWLQWPKGPTRTTLHAATHALGALGTLLLLI